MVYTFNHFKKMVDDSQSSNPFSHL
jgi:hypothetical protein